MTVRGAVPAAARTDILGHRLCRLDETISQQYEPEDAETLKELLMSVRTEDLVTKQDLAVFGTELRAELHQALYQQTRTYISWMFGLLTAYTAMAGSLVAIATIVAR